MRETSTNQGLVTAAAVSCCALMIAACGSSTKSITTAGTTGSSPLALGVRFATCMRAHGVPNFHDPTAGGSAPSGGGDTVDKRSPAFRAAQQRCQSVQAKLADLKPRPSRAAQVREAECMRRHGVPNFPDPLPGGGFSYPSTFNPQSPAAQRANAACQMR
ncbi:MAG TPA: hypothetical protein VGH93_08090 [Solirubrobacteraceae bacterium]